MTIQQIEYTLEALRLGSINKAAKSMYTSQPNVSNSIRQLESELGVRLLERTPSGVRPTPDGREFLEHGQTALAELHRILELKDTSRSAHLTVCGATYQSIDHAFVCLCTDNQALPYYTFSRVVCSLLEALESVCRHQSDLGVIAFNTRQKGSLQLAISNNSLLYLPLFQLPLSICLRSDHPLLSELHFPFEKLYNYPFVNYSTTGESFNGNAGLNSISYINQNLIIRVDNPSVRSMILHNTNAYGFCCPTFHNGQPVQDLAFVPMGVEMEFGAIRRSNSEYTAAMEKYLCYLCADVGADPPGDFRSSVDG